MYSTITGFKNSSVNKIVCCVPFFFFLKGNANSYECKLWQFLDLGYGVTTSQFSGCNTDILIPDSFFPFYLHLCIRYNQLRCSIFFDRFIHDFLEFFIIGEILMASLCSLESFGSIVFFEKCQKKNIILMPKHDCNITFNQRYIFTSNMNSKRKFGFFFLCVLQ